MLKANRHPERGTSLIEILVTLLILSFGLLGVAGLQSKVGLVELESYQRAQALLALSEMTERINANRAQAASYAVPGTLGTGDTQPADCTTLAQGANRDLCEWSRSLKGTAEQSASAAVGAMQGGRGCIVQLQSQDPSPGVCKPGIYLVSVAWQGTSPTATPYLTCGQGLYGTVDGFRRVVAATVSLATTSCQ